MEYPLGEELILVQVDRSASNLPPVHREILRPARINVDLSLEILVKTDADVGVDRGDKNYRVGDIRGQALANGMVEGLRPERRHKPKVQETNEAHRPPPGDAKGRHATARRD